MRGPTRRIRSQAAGRTAQRTPWALRANVRSAYALTAIMLVLNMFASVGVGTAFAAGPIAGNPALSSGALDRRPGTPPPMPAPNRVVVAGDFQAAIGCNGDWDKTCSASELQADGSGLWASTVAVPSGNYNFRVVTSSDIDRSLGENGDPEGGDLRFSVPDGAIGVYFSYNQNTGVIVAEAVANAFELATDFGNFPMAPTADGNFEAYVDAQADSQFNAQVLIDGNPATDPVVLDAGPRGRVHVVADSSGNIFAADAVAPTQLSVEKYDEGGNPLPGACFAVYDNRDNVLAQACDLDDSEDGFTTLKFPNGVNARSTTLAETFTPDGQATSDDQDISLDQGNNQIQVVVSGGGGENTETPTEEATEEVTEEVTEEPTQEITETAQYDVSLVAVDENGNRLPGACYSVDDNEPVCDDDGDGVVTFQLEPGDYVVTETQDPEGFSGLGQANLTVEEGGGTFQVTHTATAPIVQTGNLIIYKVDQDGNALPGSCFNVRPRSGTEGDEINPCDADDGSDDGVIEVGQLNEGRWRVEETTVPAGYTGQKAFNTDITADQTIEETVVNTLAAAETGNLTAYTADSGGNPVGGVCYNVVASDNDLGEQCDEDGDGDMGLTDLQVGTYTVSQSSVPDGYEQDSNEQQVDVSAGQDARVDFVSPASVAETGNLRIVVEDGDGNRLGGACFTVTGSDGQPSNEICDDDGDGDTSFGDLAPGEYSVDQTVAPAGYQVAGSESARVQSGDTQTVTIVNRPAEAESGALVVNVTDTDGFSIIGACVRVSGPQNAEICDNGDGDGDPEEGIIRFDGFAPGEYQIEATSLPEGFDPAEPIQATVEAGQDVTASLVSGVTIVEPTPIPAGSVLVRKVDGSGERIEGACFALDGAQTYGPVCDNQEGDADDATGRILIENVLAGDYTLTEATAPSGFSPAEGQPISVVAGETARVTVENLPAAGSISVSTIDQDGNPVAESCYTLDGGDAVCNDDGDGLVAFENVSAGDHSVTQVKTPDAYGLSDQTEQSINVAAGANAPLTFQIALLPGSIEITKTDDAGNPLGTACFSIDGGETICDDDNGDGNADAGVILINGVATGQHTISEVQAPDNYEAGPDVTVDVVAEQTAQITITNTANPGSIRIAKTDSDGQPLSGACFAIDGGEEVCDNEDGDQDDADGVIEIAAPVGQHTVSETRAPEGYTSGADQQVEVPVGGVGELTFVNDLLSSSIRITKVDEGGNPLSGACFAVDGGNPVCDNGEGDAEGADGVVQIDGITSGSRTVTETQAPAGFGIAGEQQIDLAAGQVGELTFTNSRLPGSIRVTKTDQNGNILSGACFAINDGTPVCDNDGADADGTDGIVQIDGIAEGDVTLDESTAPAGFLPGESETLTVEAGAIVDVSVVNLPANGSVQVTTTDDQSGDSLAGACYDLVGAQTFSVCDNGEGDADDADGVVLIENVPAGSYLLTQTTSAVGYELTDGELGVEVQAGQTADLTLPSTLLPVVTEEPTKEATTEPTTEPTAEPTEESTPEVTVEPTEEPTTEPTVETGSVQIQKTDLDGNPLGGACFELSGASDIGPVCDNGGSDSNGEDGIIAIVDVEAGDYVLSETNAPDGYSIGADTNLTVAANQTTETTVVNKAEPATTGTLRIQTEDGEGTSIGGACYQVGSLDVCDNETGDTDNTPGVIVIVGVVTGDYTVTETTTPDGFQPASEQQVTVNADETAELTFAHEPAEVETGGLKFTLQDPDGNPAPGACITLSDSSNRDGVEYCDGGPDDQDSAPASLLVNDLPVGAYSVAQSDLPEDLVALSASFNGVGSGNTGASALSSSAVAGGAGRMNPSAARNAGPVPNEKTVTVQVNVIIIVIIIIIVEPPTEGDFQIVKRSADTNLLQGGACFKVTGPGGEIELCDNDGFDASGTVGVIRFNDLAFGDYDVVETQAPAGYELAQPTTVTISNSGLKSITIKDQPISDTTGSLIVKKIDENGDPLTGSCFELRQGLNVIAGPMCDADDGTDDGTLSFVDVEKGNYALRETQAPSADFEPAPDQPVTIIAGKEDLTVDVVNTLKPGSILITKTAEDGSTLLEGACFGIDRGFGAEFEACDQKLSDGDGEVGIIEFESVPAGDWTLIETQAPDGFDPASDQDITVEPGGVLNLIIKNTETPPAIDKGSLKILKVDEKGDPLAGACFSLKVGAAIKASRCDNADGANDGTITFTDIAVGNYTVHETKRPSLDYLPASDFAVTITKNQIKTVTVENNLQPGRLIIRKTNQQGHLLQNACFKIVPDPNSAGQKCTGASGEVTFDNLPVDKVYKVTETKAPNGYEKSPDKTNISLTPGLTTKVTVVDKKKKPLPTDGSILVIKFFCPAGKGGEQTLTLDTSDPGSGTLAKTANCKKGNASFTVTPKAGGDPITFSTGTDGEFQTTLSAGTYTLTEKATGAKEELTVYVNQQTTVVVLNYVKPPEPKPVTIKVVKYTCAAGFEGVYFSDFINTCGQASSLTNNVVFRVSGAAVAKRTTGSTGQKGQASFTQLPAGSFTLREEVPSGASSVYAFCGYDPAAPDYKIVGDTVQLTLGAGDVFTCTWFNVPDDLSDSTGAIVVHKLTCDIQGKVPANFDWETNCGSATNGVKFALSVKQGTTFKPSKTGVTNEDGILRFSQLKPGTYQLKEVGADWCHAESDNVDAQGNLLARAGQRTNVWIYNCVKTNQPPNTGAGTTAGLDSSAGAGLFGSTPDGGTLLFGLTWPLFGLAAFGLRRRQRGYRQAA